MRTIKFRAWNGLRMITPACVGEHGEWYETGRAYENGWGDNDGLMQFTGLYDKNNQPFFEGDIIKKDNLKNEGNYVIRYDLENASYDAFKPNQPDNWTFLSSDCEIIGNIYEHPNLIP